VELPAIEPVSGFVERVSTGLAAVREFEDEGLVFLEVVSRCL
jgi:hypothetical protein